MKKLFTLAAIGLFSISGNSQTTILLDSEIDNAMYEESTNSSGIGWMHSGLNCSGNERRALVRFDIAGSVPAGATITDVTLILNNDKISISAVPTDFSIHRVTTEWGEGTSMGAGSGGMGGAPTADDATWVDAMFGTTTWTTAGGDYNPVASATTTLPASLGSFSWTSASVISDVQGWLDTPGSNFGWVILQNGAGTCQARRFGTKEQGTSPTLFVEYICAPPVAVCQDIDVYLDGAGEFTIADDDLDGGSSAVCGIDSYTASQTVFGCGDVGIGSELVITAAYDGPLPGGLPKGCEIYVRQDVANLSNFGVGFANNGGGTDGEEFTFPAVSVSAGTFIYVTSDSAEFHDWFGFAADYITGFAGINGDDAIELFKGGLVVDVFGDPDVDGSGETWEYLDGWAYRNDLTGPETPFNDANWTYSGINALDGELTNATASSPIPVGTYSPSLAGGVAVSLTVEDPSGGTDMCVATVSVFDTLAPNVVCMAAPTIVLGASGSAAVMVADIDDGTADNCGIDSMYLSIDSVFCSDVGSVDVTLYAVDFYGNIDSCTTSITVDGSSVITISADSVFDVTCNGDADGGLYITASGGTGTYTYDWDNDGTGDFDDTEDLTGLDGGSYTVIVDDGSGCTATVTASVFEPSAVDTMVTQTGETLTASASGAGVTYQWIDCSDFSPIAGETDQVFTATTEGSYACIVTEIGCSDTSSCYTIAGIGFTTSKQVEFKIFPNPVYDQLNIQLNDNLDFTYVLKDITGKTILSDSAKGKTSIETEELRSGVYLLQLKSGGQTSTRKVIVR